MPGESSTFEHVFHFPLIASVQIERALLLLYERQVDAIHKVTKFGDVQRLCRVSVQRLQFSVGEISNAGLRLPSRKDLSSIETIALGAPPITSCLPTILPEAASWWVRPRSMRTNFCGQRFYSEGS